MRWEVKMWVKIRMDDNKKKWKRRERRELGRKKLKKLKKKLKKKKKKKRISGACGRRRN